MTNIITTTQAATILGCSPNTVARMCLDGDIVAQKHAGQWEIDEADCLQYATQYHNDKRPWRREGERKPKSIIISPSSHSRQRTPGGVGLYNAVREVVKRRPDLAGVIG